MANVYVTVPWLGVGITSGTLVKWYVTPPQGCLVRHLCDRGAEDRLKSPIPVLQARRKA